MNNLVSHPFSSPPAEAAIALEAALLGAALANAPYADDKAWHAIRDITPKHFEDPLHAAMWEVVLEHRGRADLQILCNQLPRQTGRIADIFDAGAPAMLAEYAATIRANFVRLQAKTAILTSSRELSGGRDPTQVLASLQMATSQLKTGLLAEARSPEAFPASAYALRALQPRPWHVRDLIPGRQVSSISGDGGLGKSTLAVQLAVCTVSGRNWIGQIVRRGPVLYVAAEDDADEIQRRVDAICLYESVAVSTLETLNIWPLAECDPALVASGKDDSLRPTTRWFDLLSIVERTEPVLVILDSRADVFGGNEVSRAQARCFIGMLRALCVSRGLAVLLLAHPSVAGMASGSGSSGSTHWRNAVRSDLYMTKLEGEGVSPYARTLSLKKSNYGPGGITLQLRWSAGAFVVDEAEALPREPAAAAAVVDQRFLELLAEFTAQGRTVCHSSGVSYAPHLFAQESAAKGVTKSGFAAAMRRLLSDRRVLVEQYGPASKRRHRLITAPGEEVG